jgi:hypothetical protein
MRTGSPLASELLAVAVFTLVPVAVIFGLGVAVFWVIVGFKPQASN